ncbi:LRR receptor-like serine/threonine-protein kinase EFR [Acorus gramineus]|uniref:LRR receptor-like serine/threonine-protein kinase EFR n=1 Tax=Acorus gramineus TaxID=55184 RepID=A0AAV9AS28_ACOGR|nr:LRR receptor-like serine/threonine-protein kinase EFR [Acorus gramineus]
MQHKRPQVTKLKLSDLSLTGTITPEIGNLTFLRYLNLTNNSFNGHLPNSLGNLRRLKFLFVLHNVLDGPIPPSIFNISSLEIIFLGGNQLEGPIPPTILNIPSLEQLSLSFNSLTGDIPTSIGNLTQLQFLDLSDNRLTGDVVPSSLGCLVNLKLLELPGNNFQPGPMPSAVLNMSSLVVLELTSMGLFGSLPADFGLHFPSLQQLFLEYNKLTGPIPRSLSNASKLEVVDFSGSMFTGSVPASIGDLSLLQILNFEGNQLSGGLEFLSSLMKLVYLTELNLAHNQFSGFIPGPHVGNISTSLQKLFIENCSIRGSLSKTLLSNLSSLIYLELENNELTGGIPSEFKNLEKLQVLYLNGNRLEGMIPIEIFQSMIHLGTLYLSQNMFSGPISSNIGNLTSLQSISQLYYLDLSLNFLEGHLSKEIGNLQFLTTMDLSSNRLSGFLPENLGDLQMLVNLNLSNNSFSGPISQSFSRLISLNLLDLSSNSLFGQIPKSLANLRYLSFLNLSYNRLEGEVPNGGVFANITVQSLMGNPALCGATTLGLPPCKSSNAKRMRKATIMLKYIIPSFLFCVTMIVSVFYLLNKKWKSKRPNSIDRTPSLLHQRFVSEREIVRATTNFHEENLLGTGSSSSVYKGQLEDGTIVAIKVLKLGFSKPASKRFEAECEVMRNVRHRNLLKIISSCSTENFKALVLQYMPNKSLEKWLNNSQNHILGVLERVAIMSDVASALEYLHHGCSRPVVHSDVKPCNILLDEDMVAHLGDFGIAKLLAGDHRSATPTSTLGTVGYVAPGVSIFKHLSSFQEEHIQLLNNDHSHSRKISLF